MFSAIPIKTPEEIKMMRLGGIILTKTLDLMEKSVRPGISTLELDEIAEDFIRSHAGATPGFKGYRGFPASICASINSECVHGIPDDTIILKEGDVIGIDCGVKYNGLYTDACRTFIIGDVSYEEKHLVKTTKDALNKAVKVIRPGGHIGDISATIQEILERQGFSPVIDCTGHGVGRDLHEPPEILNAGEKNTGPVMKTGMVLAIEPISSMGNGQIITADDKWTVITEDNTLSAHFEQTVAVTENSHEIIAK